MNHHATISAGIIGYGVSARTFHQPFISTCTGIHLSTILSRQERPDCPADVVIERHLELFLARPDLDVVIITAPNVEHYALAKAALDAGKHVVIEKPMTVSLAQALELKSLAETKKCLLTVFHNRRLDGDFLTVQAQLAAGTFGQVKRFTSHWDRWRPQVRPRWREEVGAGSGIWYDLAPHLIDQALCLFGIPQAITAHCRMLRPNCNTCDDFSATLHYPDKYIELGCSPYCAAAMPRFTIYGSQGSYYKYGLDPQEAQIKSGLSVDDVSFGLTAPEEDGIFYDHNGHAQRIPTLRGRFSDYYANLVATLHGQSAPLVPINDALRVMQLLELGIESSQQQRTLSVPELIL